MGRIGNRDHGSLRVALRLRGPASRPDEHPFLNVCSVLRGLAAGP